MAKFQEVYEETKEVFNTHINKHYKHNSLFL